MNLEKTPLMLEDIASDLSLPIMRYLERYVGNRAIAEELWQETLVKVNRGWDSFAGRSSVKTWVFSIASRVAADHMRQPGQKICLVDMNEAGEPADADCAIEDRLVEGEMNECVRRIIDGMPGAYREVLILHDLEEFSVEQTATICGCTVAAAKIRIHRARARLKDAILNRCEFYHDADNVFRCSAKPVNFKFK